LFILSWIKIPAAKNINALNKACVIKWKKPIVKNPEAIINIIRPSWLNVDIAIIFFKSYSNKADKPLNNMVNEEI